MKLDYIAREVNKATSYIYDRSRRLKTITELAHEYGTTQKEILAELKRQTEVRASRVAARRTEPQPSLQARLERYLVRLALHAAVARRVGTPTGWSWPDARVTDRVGRSYVVHAEYRHHYSRRQQWWTGASYLVGYEIRQRFEAGTLPTQQALAEEFGISKPTVNRLVKAATKTHK